MVRFCWGFVRVSSRGIYWRLCYSNSTSTDSHNRSLRRRPSRCWVRCLPILCTLQYPRKLLRMVHDRTVLCGSRLIDWIPYIARFSRRRLLARRAHVEGRVRVTSSLCRLAVLRRPRSNCRSAAPLHLAESHNSLSSSERPRSRSRRGRSRTARRSRCAARRRSLWGLVCGRSAEATSFEEPGRHGWKRRFLPGLFSASCA